MLIAWDNHSSETDTASRPKRTISCSTTPMYWKTPSAPSTGFC